MLEYGLSRQTPGVTNTPGDPGIRVALTTGATHPAKIPAPQLTSTSTNPDQALVATCVSMLSFPGRSQ